MPEELIMGLKMARASLEQMYFGFLQKQNAKASQFGMLGRKRVTLCLINGSSLRGKYLFSNG